MRNAVLTAVAIAASATVTILATWGVLTLLAVPSLISLQAYVAATLRDGPNNRELYRASEIVATTGSTRPILVDATLSGTRVSTGRDGTGVLEYLLILDARQAVRRLQPEQLVTAVERIIGPPIPTQVGFGIDALTLGGASLQNIRGDVEFAAGAIALSGLELRAPGFTQVQASGRLEKSGGQLRFVGPVDVSAGNRGFECDLK